MSKRRTSITLDKSLYQRIKTFSESKNRNFSNMIEIMAEDYINRNKNTKL